MVKSIIPSHPTQRVDTNPVINFYVVPYFWVDIVNAYLTANSLLIEILWYVKQSNGTTEAYFTILQ